MSAGKPTLKEQADINWRLFTEERKIKEALKEQVKQLEIEKRNLEESNKRMEKMSIKVISKFDLLKKIFAPRLISMQDFSSFEYGQEQAKKYIDDL